MTDLHGGAIIGECLARHGVRHLFTLCGGHISPILVGAKNNGIKVVDVRDEVTAVFAADAVARMTGIPGVAAVTAGPGVTNTVTAVKNAQMAQSPLLVFGGATATILKGRGSLQDIDQLSLMRPITKWATTIRTFSSLAPTVERALEVAADGVPGPVFVEVPVDLLYPEEMVRDWYMKESGVEGSDNFGARALGLFLKGHLLRQFHQPHIPNPLPHKSQIRMPSVRDEDDRIDKLAERIRAAERPVLVVGSQAVVNMTQPEAERLADSIRTLGMPTFLAGGARGLLGRRSDIQFRHKRSASLKKADLAIICGFPFDFRLGYGRSFGSKTSVVAANLSTHDLRKNRRPDMGFEIHPGALLNELAASLGDRDTSSWGSWFDDIREREDARDADITGRGDAPSDEGRVNPVKFFLALEEKLADDAVLVVDGGDFVATAAYILRPRKPLNWLDPGVFGTLGVGGGFATGAALARPESEVWLLYGDGSSAYSLAEFDTYVRHGLAPIAVIGTDASWQQIARDQVEILEDDIGTVLLRTEYHKVAEGYGGVGLLLTDESKIEETIDEAKRLSAEGKPVCINIHIAANDFRKGSLSM